MEQIIKDHAFRDISAGVHHSLLLCADGTLYGWGRTDSGQLAVLDTQEMCRTVPTQINGIFEVRKICCGGNHNLALVGDGDVYSWGYGGMMQLGNENEADEVKPYHIKLKGERKSLAVAAGGQHSVILVKAA